MKKNLFTSHKPQNPAPDSAQGAPKQAAQAPNQPASPRATAPKAGAPEDSALADLRAENAALNDQAAKLTAENTALGSKVTELTGDLQRTRADFENFRRRNEEQKLQHANSAKLATVSKLLPLLDDLDRAILANPDTLAPLAKNFEKTLKSLGLAKIPSTPDTEFDPDLHEAISSSGDGDTDFVAETLRDGYYYDSEVLRPALVRVEKR